MLPKNGIVCLPLIQEQTNQQMRSRTYTQTQADGQTPGNTKREEEKKIAYELVWKYLNIMWLFDRLAELQMA